MPDAPDDEAAAIPRDQAEAFFAGGRSEADSAFWGFRVIWHEQAHAVAVREGGRIVGAAAFEIAAGVAHLQRVVVLPEMRRRGYGRALLARVAEIANYYNCHKITAQAPKGSAAEAFLAACGYRVEATLPQHAFKLDVDVLRRFLL